MANQNDPFFTIDAGKILAKLHLAAKTQVTTKDAVVENSGIEDEEKNDTPEKPGKTTFNLDKGKGEYTLSITYKYAEFKPQINLETDKNVEGLRAELKKTNDKFNKASAVKEAEEILSEADPQPASTPAAKPSPSPAAKPTAPASSSAPTKQNPKATGPLADKNYANEVAADFKKWYSKLFDKEELAIADKNKEADPIKKMNADIDAVNNYRAAKMKEPNEPFKKSAIDDVKKYFTVFAGKENANKIKESEVKYGLIKINGLAKTTVDKDKSEANTIDDIANIKELAAKANATGKLDTDYKFTVKYSVETEAV
jgi:hypothetical protein